MQGCVRRIWKKLLVLMRAGEEHGQKISYRESARSDNVAGIGCICSSLFVPSRVLPFMYHPSNKYITLAASSIEQPRERMVLIHLLYQKYACMRYKAPIKADVNVPCKIQSLQHPVMPLCKQSCTPSCAKFSLRLYIREVKKGPSIRCSSNFESVLDRSGCFCSPATRLVRS